MTKSSRATNNRQTGIRMQQEEIKMFLSHLRESSGSAADLWPAKMDENDILSQQNITNLKPKFSLVPALSMWGGQEKQPQPCSVWSCSVPRHTPCLGWTHTSRLLPSSSSSASLLSAQIEHKPSLQHPGILLLRKIWMPVGT